MKLTRQRFCEVLAGAWAAPPGSAPALVPAVKQYRALGGRAIAAGALERTRVVAGDPEAPGSSPEAYRLRIDAGGIVLTSRSEAGVRMGRRTLAQLALDGPPPNCEIVDWPDFPLRAAHLCYHLIRETLAYNCPNFSALLEHIDELAALKYNALLLELEAMFPHRRHPRIPARIAFTRGQIAELRRKAEGHGMELIPLVQCLGHAYAVLWHEEYAAYREVPGTCQQYCPTNPRVADLYMEFVDEYLEAFPGVRQWHMGGDESRQLAQCPRCKQKAEKFGTSRLYADHVAEIAQRLHRRGLVPLLWSDMFEHHPEALSHLPRYVRIVYWNYDLPKWPRPYALPRFRDAGFEVIAAPGVRFNAIGTELSLYYAEALRGIETLIPAAKRDGASGIMVTNWMKGSPHENAHYGFAYAASRCWNAAGTREDFQPRYARVAFGIQDSSICDAYDLLSVKLPYAEPVQLHMPDRLNRFDLTGLRFPEKWKRYTAPDWEPKVIEQLRAALEGAARATQVLARAAPRCRRGRRQLELLAMSAACMQAKARLALALHAGRQLATGAPDPAALGAWRSGLPAILAAWRAAKRRHHQTLAPSGFAPCVDFLNELMFEPAEYDALLAMGARLGGKKEAERT